MFRFAHYGWLLLLIPVFMAWHVGFSAFRRRRLERFVGTLGSTLVPDLVRWRRGLKLVLWSLGFLFLVMAIMRPYYGQNAQKIRRKGHDIFVLIDASKSMLAMDVKPSRLAFAKSELLAMLPDLKGDRVGLIVFEGDAFVQCPLTLDYAALSLFLDDVSAGAISRPGTNLAKAIEMASDNFSKKSTSREKIMVVFSDGESFEEDPVVSARNAAQKGAVIYTVALGSPTGEPIPILDAAGQLVGYKKDRDNNVILTKTNITVLRQVAEVSKGACLEGNAFGVSEQVCQLIAKRDRFDLGGVQSLSFNEKYQPFLLLAFLCFFLEFVIPDRRRFYAS